MAISDQIQMLVSAFIFGLLFQSTIAALLLCIKGHGSTLFQDHRRLALVLFLIFSALWAQTDFINFTIPSTSPTACQITIIASTFFDQAARIFISGFLLWSVAHAKKTHLETVALSALMGIRVVVGVVFVIFARPQFAPVCIARSDLLPASIIVMALDIIVIGILTIRVFTLGLLNVIRNVRPSKKQEQSKSHVFCIAAFILWTVTSSFMMIGIPAVTLLLRTALPAVGLVVLVSILTIYVGALVLPLDNDCTTPEARSPFVVPAFHSSSSLSNDDGSPVREDGFARTANLFVVNPSNTPHDSSAMVYLEDVKAEDDSYARYQSTSSRSVNEESGVPLSSDEITNNRTPSGILQSLSAATLEAISSAAFLSSPRQAPIPAASRDIQQTRDKPSVTAPTPQVEKKRARFGWSKKSAEKGVHRIMISNPIMQDTESLTNLPFNKIRTIDLATAAASERERRDDARNRQLVAKRPAPPPPTASDAWRKSNSTRRKEVPKGASTPSTSHTVDKVSGTSRLSVTVNANSTSASLSPGREDVRRRSPRSMKAVEGEIETAYFLASRPKTIGALKRESQETVMYVNDIIYDHPSMVKSIIKEAPTSKNRQRESMKSSKSLNVPSEPIIHRPRPYKRDSEEDRVVFPTLQHKRSRSGPSPGVKSSVLESRFSNLDTVPTAPQRPTTAAGLRKILPNDTRSMTVDEKISMLFPAPPGAHLLHNRRSSVPSLPRIPSSILLGGAPSTTSVDQESLEHRASKRTTISFGSQIQNDGVVPTAETPIIGEHGIYRFSANTYRNLAGSPRNSRLSGLPVDSRINESSDSKIAQPDGSKNQRESTITSFSSEVDGPHDDSKSVWASIHSPVPAIDVKTAQMTARETYIKMRKDANISLGNIESDFFHAPISGASKDRNVIGDGEGLMTAMFGKGDVIQTSENMVSFLLTPSPLVTHQFITRIDNAWHRRIGDELPAFSRRRKDLRSRTMPPPTPLVLGSNRRQPPIIRESLVDQGNDLPENALKEILAQLHKFDTVSRESSGHPMHDKPQESSESLTPVLDDKIGLLENLEKEMGQQETFWMRMQHNFDRDSNSTIMTPQPVERTPRALPSPPSDTSSIGTARSMKKRLHTHDRGNKPRFDNFIQTPNNSKADIWRRLTEAQMEFNGNPAGLLGSRDINFLSISKGQQLSPTPPDSLASESESGTDMGYDTDEQTYESELEKSSPLTEKSRAALWLPTAPASAAAAKFGHLWSHNQDISTLRTTSCEPVAKGLRPIQRRNLEPLSITSRSLWSKATLHANQISKGLWTPRLLSPKVTISRPKAQRPARKSKRVTFLPAIIENPSPLPYKRDTLGIFQFPWGEKSDCAIYDPIPASDQATLVPFVFSPNFEPKPIHSESEPTEYSSSFFDDYEEDYEDRSEANSDDEFDESTLWEIATLLDSQDVPSRNSLFPSPKIIEDYDDEDDSEPESIENSVSSNRSTSTSAWPAMVKFIPVQPLKPLPPLPTMPEVDDHEHMHAIAGQNPLISPSEWQVYLPALDNAVREESLDSLTQEYCSSNPETLWDNDVEPNLKVPVKEVASLWTLPGTDKANQSSSVPRYGVPAGPSLELLWTAKAALPLSTENVVTVQVPGADKIVRRPRVDNLPIATLSTNHLWKQNVPSLSEYNWISASAIRVQSPSVCSTSLLGILSPSSDEESIDSAITEDSSDTRLNPENIIENVDDSAQPKSIASSTISQLQISESSLASTDVLESPSKRPISLRGSKVLASRDLWESRSSTVGTSSSQKVWRSSKTFNRTQEAKSLNGSDHIVPPTLNLGSNIALTIISVHIPATKRVVELDTSHDALKPSNQLWTPKSSATGLAPKSSSLWSQSLSSKRNALSKRPLISKDIATRKVTINHESHALPTLSSTSIWSPKTLNVSVQHWLHATSLKAVSASPKAVDHSRTSALHPKTFSEETTAAPQSVPVPELSNLTKSSPVSTWKAPLRSNTVSGAQGKGLWSPGEKSQKFREAASAMAVVPLKRSSSYASTRAAQASLGKIESAELWRPKWGLPESPKDWLTSRRSRKVEFRY